MKTSEEYYKMGLKKLGSSERNGVPMQAAVNMGLMEAMKDFLEEIDNKFCFDYDGCLEVKVNEHREG